MIFLIILLCLVMPVTTYIYLCREAKSHNIVENNMHYSALLIVSVLCFIFWPCYIWYELSNKYDQK